MLIKSAILFLLFMVAIAIWGRFRGPKRRTLARRASPEITPPRPSAKRDPYCPGCGRRRIGPGPCACGRP
nr:hypothetical protein [Rubellimicrobium mesophilum]